MEDTVSMDTDRRSATRVMPTGASQPPIWRVWMPSLSTRYNMVALRAMRKVNTVRVTARWAWTYLDRISVSAAATAGRMTGMGTM